MGLPRHLDQVDHLLHPRRPFRRAQGQLLALAVGQLAAHADHAVGRFDFQVQGVAADLLEEVLADAELQGGVLHFRLGARHGVVHRGFGPAAALQLEAVLDLRHSPHREGHLLGELLRGPLLDPAGQEDVPALGVDVDVQGVEPELVDQGEADVGAQGSVLDVLLVARPAATGGAGRGRSASGQQEAGQQGGRQGLRKFSVHARGPPHIRFPERKLPRGRPEPWRRRTRDDRIPDGMSEAPSQSPTARRPPFLPGGAVATGLAAALCAGGLDLSLSLWLENPAGLRSGTNLLLTFAASTAFAFAAWLAAYVLLRLLLRSRQQPLAIPVSASLLTAVLLRGILLSVSPAEASLGRAVLPLAVLVLAVGFLASKLTNRGKGGGAPLPVGGGAMGEGTGVRSFAATTLLALAATPLLLLDRNPAPARSPAHPPAVPHVILLSIDTLRGDALACSGASETRAPHLDSLAAESLCFSRASSSAAWTLPAMASVMTGVSPQVHGAVHVRGRMPD